MKKAKLMELIGEAMGEASMAWSETPKGTFNSTRVVELLKEVEVAVDAYVENRIDFVLKDLELMECD